MEIASIQYTTRVLHRSGNIACDDTFIESRRSVHTDHVQQRGKLWLPDDITSLE
jgi:hypothetical protein